MTLPAQLPNFVTPPTLTPAQALATKVLGGSNQLFKLLGTQIPMMFNAIWNNPDKTNLTAPLAWAALGTQAVKVRTAFLAIAPIISSLSGGAVTLTEPSNATIVENQDGSITCTMS